MITTIPVGIIFSGKFIFARIAYSLSGFFRNYSSFIMATIRTVFSCFCPVRSKRDCFFAIFTKNNNSVFFIHFFSKLKRLCLTFLEVTVKLLTSTGSLILNIKNPSLLSNIIVPHFIIFSIFFLFSFSSPVFAADNPVLIGYPENKIMGFRGLDTSATAPTIEDGRAADLLNVVISDSFDLKKRYGYSVVNDTLDDWDISHPAITGIFDAEYSDTSSYTYAFVGSKLKYDTGTTWTTVNGTATITTDYQWSCAMALDYAVCTNNQDKPLKISNAPVKSELSFGTLSSIPTKAKAVFWYRNYLILGNTYETSSRPTRFRWSNVGTVETFTETDYDDLASLNGDEIVAFREMYGDLYIIMRKSIWKASLVGGDDIFVYTKLVEGVGAIAKGSVQLVTFPGNKQGIVFLNEEKRVYLFNGVTVTDIGGRIQPTLDGLSASRLQYAASTFDGDNYILSVTTSTNSVNDKIYLYNVVVDEWFVYDGFNANVFARVKESTSVIKTYFGNYKSFVYWFDDSDLDNDVAGGAGIVDSIGRANYGTQTGAYILIDATIADELFTGATVRITSGTGADEDAVVVARVATGLVLASTPTTTWDTTSIYSVGDINSYYNTKFYDLGDSARKKGFRKLYFWAKEESTGEVTISYAEDFGTTLASSVNVLDPITSSLWDSALWDEGIWGSSGDKFYSTRLSGVGRTIQLKFSQSSIDKKFNIYGFHILADALDRE